MRGSYLVSEAVAMEVHRVQVYLIAHSPQVPADFISHVHGEALQVPKHSSINSWGEHRILKLRFGIFETNSYFTEVRMIR